MSGTQDDRWEQVQPTIAGLHNLGLRYEDIREYVDRQHGFRASDAAFKRHFKAWGLRRYATEDDYRVLAMIIDHLGIDIRKPDHRPYFLVRGRRLDYYSVLRSIKRLRIFPENVGDVPVNQLAHIKLIHPQNAPFRPLVTPTDLASPEIALRKTQQIYKLPYIYDRVGADHLRKCQDSYRWALQAINQSEYISATEHVHTALDQLELAAKQGTLDLSPLFTYATVQAQADASDIVRAYLEKFLAGALGLIEIYYSTNHPFTVTFRALRNATLRDELSIRILELIRDQLYMSNIQDKRLGHELSDEVEVILLDALRHLGQLDKAIAHCYSVIRHRAQLFPPFHLKRLVAQNTLANCCLSNGDLQGAQEALRIVLDDEDDERPDARWSRTYPYFEALRLKAITLKRQSRDLEAGRLLERAVQELSSPDLDLANLEAILQVLIRMMNQIGCNQEGGWMAAQIPDVIFEARQGQFGSAPRLQRLVRDYFDLFVIRE